MHKLLNILSGCIKADQILSNYDFKFDSNHKLIHLWLNRLFNLNTNFTYMCPDIQKKHDGRFEKEGKIIFANSYFHEKEKVFKV